MITSLLSVQNVELSTVQDKQCCYITDLNMKESSILVISVIIKLHNRVIFRLTYQQSTPTLFISVTTVTIRQSGDKVITLTSNLTRQLFNLNKFCVKYFLENKAIRNERSSNLGNTRSF